MGSSNQNTLCYPAPVCGSGDVSAKRGGSGRHQAKDRVHHAELFSQVLKRTGTDEAKEWVAELVPEGSS